MNPQTKKSNMESGVESGLEMGLKTAPIGIPMIHLCIRWVMLVLMTALCSNLFKWIWKSWNVGLVVSIESTATDLLQSTMATFNTQPVNTEELIVQIKNDNQKDNQQYVSSPI